MNKIKIFLAASWKKIRSSFKCWLNISLNFSLFLILLFSSFAFSLSSFSFKTLAPFELIEMSKKFDDDCWTFASTTELTKESVYQFSDVMINQLRTKYGFRESLNFLSFLNEQGDFEKAKITNLIDSNGAVFNIESYIESSIIDFTYYNAESHELPYFYSCYIKKYMSDSTSFNYTYYIDSFKSYINDNGIDVCYGIIASSSLCDKIIQLIENKLSTKLHYEDIIGKSILVEFNGKKCLFPINNIFMTYNEKGEHYLGDRIDAQYGYSFILDTSRSMLCDANELTAIINVLHDSINFQYIISKLSYLKGNCNLNFQMYAGYLNNKNLYLYSDLINQMLIQNSNSNDISNIAFFILYLFALIYHVLILIISFFKKKLSWSNFTILGLIFLFYELIMFCTLHNDLKYIMFNNLFVVFSGIILLFLYLVLLLLSGSKNEK